MSMQRADGPECPDCGCEESDVLESRQRFNQPWERRQCTACGRVWSAEVEEVEPEEEEGEVGSGWDGHAVDFMLICCPNCNSTRVPVTSTVKPTRYHKCKDCGQPFKSVEKKATHF